VDVGVPVALSRAAAVAALGVLVAVAERYGVRVGAVGSAGVGVELATTVGVRVAAAIVTRVGSTAVAPTGVLTGTVAVETSSPVRSKERQAMTKVSTIDRNNT
jgi:hypothetical protein